ncbi:MAG: thiamine phosphate synthase, partial [Candidatus Omnitrophota bacterium]
KNLIKNWKLYCIIDPSVVKGGNPATTVDFLFKNGAKIVQLRYKQEPAYAIVPMAKKIVQLAKKYNKTVIINDRLDVALASRASGVHLGSGDMSIQRAKALLGSSYIIGKTVHSINEAKIAAKEKPDYIGVGPIFATPIKKNLKPKGVAFIGKTKRASGLPTFAIGGINRKNCGKIARSSADGVCVTRAIFSVCDLLEELKK